MGKPVLSLMQLPHPFRPTCKTNKQTNKTHLLLPLSDHVAGHGPHNNSSIRGHGSSPRQDPDQGPTGKSNRKYQLNTSGPWRRHHALYRGSFCWEAAVLSPRQTWMLLLTCQCLFECFFVPCVLFSLGAPACGDEYMYMCYRRIIRV